VSTLPGCNSSEFAMLWQAENGRIFYVQAPIVQWSTNEATIQLLPEGSEDESFLAGLQPSRDPVIIGHGHRVGICHVVDNRYMFESGKAAFSLRVAVQRSDFTPPIEVALGSTSADKLAELRARRLLLNENPYVESRDINAITQELFIEGQDTVIRIQRSPFPDLYRQFGSNPGRFLGIAWISAVVQLKLSACVVEVVTLQLSSIKLGISTQLNVSFRGRRKKQYQNRPPYEMSIEGICALT